MSSEKSTAEEKAGTPEKEASTPAAKGGQEKEPLESGTPKGSTDSVDLELEKKDKRISDLTSLFNKKEAEADTKDERIAELEEERQAAELEDLTELEKEKKLREQAEAKLQAKEEEEQEAEALKAVAGMEKDVFKKHPKVQKFVAKVRETDTGFFSVAEDVENMEDAKADLLKKAKAIEEQLSAEEKKEEEEIIDPNNPTQKDLDQFKDLSVPEMEKVIPKAEEKPPTVPGI